LESEPDVSPTQERTSKIQKCENINNDAENDGKKENIEQSLLEFINMVENNDSGELLNPTLKVYWEKLMFLLGQKLCREPLYKDGLTLAGKYKDTNF